VVRRIALLLLGLAMAGCGGQRQGRRPAPSVVGVSAEAHVEVGFQIGGDSPAAAPVEWRLASAHAFDKHGGWNIDVVLDLGDRQPPDGAVDYRFDLAQTTAYEAVSDGDGGPPVVIARRLDEKQLFAHEQPICFRATSSSHGRYRVTVRLERSLGLTPGEYQVELRDERSRRLGRTHSLVLH
jgi:hypothetical protein